jgi:hypothetical protein
MPSVKNLPPWAPQAVAPLSNGSLTLTVSKPSQPVGNGKKRLPSLTAAATRVTGSPAKTRINRHITTQASRAWQEEVLAAANVIGELRYIINTTANAASRAWVFPADARRTADATQKSSPVPRDRNVTSSSAPQDNAPEEDGAPPGAVDSEIVRRAAQLMVSIGEFYIVELPRGRGRPGSNTGREVHILAPMDVAFRGDDTVVIGGTVSGSSGQVTGGKEYPLIGPGAAKLTRVHRPDARNADEPDSPARSALPVMRQLLGVEMHTSATIDSRTATAGIVEYPIDAEVQQPAGAEPGTFADVLSETMGTAIQEPDSAERLVPILIGIPPGMGTGDKSALHWHMPPGSTLDAQAATLIDQNIRRIALGMDAPPEVILGAKGLSHFGAWSVEGEFIRLQIAPLLKLICDGLSVAFDIEYVFDTGPLTVRPNRAVEAQALYDRGAIGAATLRAACGFSEDDAPSFPNKDAEALDLARQMVKDSPSLMSTPGFPAIVDQCRVVLGLKPKFAHYYPGKEAAPLAGGPTADTNGRENPRNGGDGQAPEGNRPVSDGSPEGGADGQPHQVPGTA